MLTEDPSYVLNYYPPAWGYRPDPTSPQVVYDDENATTRKAIIAHAVRAIQWFCYERVPSYIPYFQGTSLPDWG